ncbi:cobalamin biosynthesis protein [Chelativorans salis]|uniref:cobalamin biosynthesis protein n=1 Tax=Chelativorans salis TaxID=2978478 RepID=UPI0021B27287|nr:cobalamin biosynthesis protein [Chelativorans sp. EGI FJ00035]
MGEVLAAVEACRAYFPDGVEGWPVRPGKEPFGASSLRGITPTPHPSPQGGGEVEAPRLDALATAAFKADEPGIVAAAEALGLSLIPVPHDDLKRASAGCLTRSGASLAATGVASVSEAAALAAAGEGSQLLGPRIATGNVTCAIAQGKDQA